MAIFTKPKNLNGAELRNELRLTGIEISDESSAVAINEDGNLVLNILDSDIEKAAKIVEKHDGTTLPPEPSIQEKLASVNLSLDELKAALGL